MKEKQKGIKLLSTQQFIYIHLIDSKLRCLILYLLVFALLWVGYSSFIVPVYGYSGFIWALNGIKVIEALFVTVFFALILPSEFRKPSDIFIHVNFLLPVVPMLVLYSASDLPRKYMYFVLMAFIIVYLVRGIKLPKIRGNTIPANSMTWVLLSIAAIYVLSVVLQGGLQFFNLNLLKVYEFRSLVAQNLPKITGYLSPMISKVLLPFILLLAVYSRKWLIAGLAFAGSVMMFALTNHKGPLFYPLLVLGIYFIMSLKRKNIQLLLACYILVILVSLAPFLINNSQETEQPLSRIIVGSLLLRRVCFVPAHLNFVYYDFFSKHPHTMLAESKVTFGLIDYPYDLDSAHLIGYHYYNNEMTGANTGWLGTGYMHFGFEGMVIYALLIGISLSFVDMLARKGDVAISGAILFSPFFALFVFSDLPTTLLTHGLLLALFLTWFCRLNLVQEDRAITVKNYNRLS